MIHHGDCLEVMPTLDAESIDAIVTDPPYGLGFMGKHWDHGCPGEDFWREILRLAKPGAYLLSFGGTRTVHRLASAIEDAGWIIRDLLVWGYASGFPKGRANLKPAWEPIVMARKPGPLRELAIDACRIAIGEGDGWDVPMPSREINPARPAAANGTPSAGRHPDGLRATPARLGRWPANIVLTDPIFDGGWDGVVGGGETSIAPPGRWTSAHADAAAFPIDRGGTVPTYGDSGTYSRFFMLPSRSGALSGTMGTCQTCGAPIAEPPSTARTPRPDTAPPSADTLPLALPGQPVSGVDSPSPSPATATAPRRAATPPGGTPESMASAARSPKPTDTDASDPSTSPEPRPDTASPSDQPARTAGQPPTSTGTTTTTADRVTCGRCAERATSGLTQLPAKPSVRGRVPADEDDYTRFLIIPKAARSDREPVLGGQLTKVDVFRGHQPDNPKCLACGRQRIGPLGAPACECDDPEWAAVGDRQRENSHPTVKPTDLMRHLVRLVTPPGGVVLDPFLGSGTTALAAEMEGFGWVGIEREEEYVRIAEARLNGTQRGLAL